MVALQDENGLLNEEEKQCIIRAAEETLCFLDKKGNIEIMALKEELIKKHNKSYRGVDKITDVLSFPAAIKGEHPADGYWGDILICPIRAREQALLYGHSQMRELAFLAIHGTLHLLGYDHEKAKDEKEMFSLQKQLLERMNIVGYLHT